MPDGSDEEQFDQLLGVSLDATSICNLRCTTCSLEDSYKDKGVMSPQTFSHLDDAFPRLKHVAFSSSAEPLLNRHLEEWITHAKARSDGRIVTSFTTNATLLDRNRATKLIESGLDALEISLDGISKRTYERIRIRANFDVVMENLTYLMELRLIQRRFVPHVSVRFTMFEDNKHELIPMILRLYSLGVRHLVVNGLEPYTEEMAQKVLFGPTARPEMVALFETAEALANSLKMRIDLPRLVPDVIDDCNLIDHSCILLHDGTVVPCSPVAYPRPYIWSGTRYQHDRVSFGNINERPLFEIWHSPEYTQWRADVRSGKLFDYCKTCLKRAAVICPLRHWKWLRTPRPQVVSVRAADTTDATLHSNALNAL